MPYFPPPSSGGITNAAGSNVVTKSNGTNIVASQITDNGTTVVIPAITNVGSATGIRSWIVRDLNGNNFAALYNGATSGGVADGTYAFAAAAAETRVNSPTGGLVSININNVEVAKFDATATAGNTRFLIYDVDNGTLERVTVGAADSGGAGFKVLRIPN